MIRPSLSDSCLIQAVMRRITRHRHWLLQVWLSFAALEATPQAVLGQAEAAEDGQEEAPAADRAAAAAQQEDPQVAADREATARRCVHHVANAFALPFAHALVRRDVQLAWHALSSTARVWQYVVASLLPLLLQRSC